MQSTYSELVPDSSRRDMWYLGWIYDNLGQQLDARFFTRGVPLASSKPAQLPAHPYGNTTIEVRYPLRVELRKQGVPLDFSFATFCVPIVTYHVAELLSSIAGADIQRLPVQIDSRDENYELINIISGIDCINRDRSTIQYWTKENGPEDIIGQMMDVTNLTIDPERTSGRHLFRPLGWEGVMIVSDALRRLLEENHISGIAFESVGLAPEKRTL